MPNVISLLIVSAAMIVGLKSGAAPNPLLSVGLLIVLAYLASVMMKTLRLPAFIGYILTGMLAGPDGLSLVPEGFAARMSFVEALCVMLLVAETVRYLLDDTPAPASGRNLAIGAVSSFITFLVVTGILASSPAPLRIKVALGLFASTFSPFVVYFYARRGNVSKDHVYIAFGGYLCALVLWGIMIAVFGPSGPHRIRIAFMPVMIGFTSLIAGISWAFLSERFLYAFIRNQSGFHRIAAMFLIYPCARELGLDFLFIAAGMGVYDGFISGRKTVGSEGSEPAWMFVFVLFGMGLSIGDTFTIGIQGWTLVVTVLVSMVFCRFTTLSLARKLFGTGTGPASTHAYAVVYGPLTFLLLRRFIPGLAYGSDWQSTGLSLLPVMTTTMMLTVVLAAVIQAVANTYGEKSGADTMNES